MNNLGRQLAVWAVIILALMLLYNLFQAGTGLQSPPNQVAYSDFLKDVDQGKIKTVVIIDNQLSGTMADGKAFQSYAPSDPNLVSRLTEKGVQVSAKPPGSDVSPFIRYLPYWLPIVLLCLFWGFMMRQMQGGSGRAMGFGRSRAKLLTEKQGRITFKDVAGIDEAKNELQEIVDFLREPSKFQKLGGRIPKGALLIGPPGTGKTLLARAIAGEANVPFFTISGSDFVEMFVGVGASRVRDMFEQGKKSAPCIIFIDEIDAVGRHRGAGLGGGNDEREQTLNQLLVEMDGFDSTQGVILLAATNRPDVLDSALLRPGRFDRQVTVPLPDISGREQILRVHMRKVPLASDVDPRVIARGTPGFSGADLANLVNEAALMAARQSRRNVSMHNFEMAKDKVLMGAERRSIAMSEDEKRMTAYHEGGHALCSVLTPGSDPVHKATIIPRGRALGMVMNLPEGDRYSQNRTQLHAILIRAMGGRAAEELIFGHDKVSSGASSDIKAATDLARSMVTEWGLSDRLGPINYTDGQDSHVGLFGSGRALSSETTRLIEEEIKHIVEDAHTRALKLLKENVDVLHCLAKALLEYETLSGEEINRIVQGEKIVRDVERDASVSRPRPSISVGSSSRNGKTKKPSNNGLAPLPQPS